MMSKTENKLNPFMRLLLGVGAMATVMGATLSRAQSQEPSNLDPSVAATLSAPTFAAQVDACFKTAKDDLAQGGRGTADRGPMACSLGDGKSGALTVYTTGGMTRYAASGQQDLLALGGDSLKVTQDRFQVRAQVMKVTGNSGILVDATDPGVENAKKVVGTTIAAYGKPR